MSYYDSLVDKDEQEAIALRPLTVSTVIPRGAVVTGVLLVLNSDSENYVAPNSCMSQSETLPVGTALLLAISSTGRTLLPPNRSVILPYRKQTK